MTPIHTARVAPPGWHRERRPGYRNGTFVRDDFAAQVAATRPERWAVYERSRWGNLYVQEAFVEFTTPGDAMRYADAHFPPGRKSE